MGQDPSTSGAAVSGESDPEQIREEIDATRQELGDTVEALAAKTDVKRQAKEKLEDAKTTASEKKDELLGKARETSPEAAVSAASSAAEKARRNPLPLAVAGAFVLGMLIGNRRGRRKS